MLGEDFMPDFGLTVRKDSRRQLAYLVSQSMSCSVGDRAVSSRNGASPLSAVRQHSRKFWLNAQRSENHGPVGRSTGDQRRCGAHQAAPRRITRAYAYPLMLATSLALAAQLLAQGASGPRPPYGMRRRATAWRV